MKILRLIPLLLLLCVTKGAQAQKVTILHTNDTHSIIDPFYENNLGGAMRRMALIDSVRNADRDVILVDAGDAVQGSLYFTLFKGAAEREVMNYLDYDIQILGNHEFDNGMEMLGDYLDGIDATLLATNYDFSDTPLDDVFEPYTIKEIDGKRIAFFALNVEPDGLIDSAKIVGVRYTDPEQCAAAMAWYLRNVKHADKVVAVSHIGYPADVEIARNTRGIDLIIGGHSHTTVSPADRSQWLIPNLDGDSVAVVQTGRYGANLGKVTIDFDNNRIDYKLLPINSRLDSFNDEQLVEIIAPYKHEVDSVRAIPVGKASKTFTKTPEMANWMADFVMRDSRRITAEKPHLAIVNTGGIRSNFTKGVISKGTVMEAFPFDNYEVIVEVPGSALSAMLSNLAASNAIGVSKNVDIAYEPSTGNATSITVDGRPIDPAQTYRVATINYLAQGNDGLTALKNCPVTAADSIYLYDAMLNAFTNGFLKKKVQRHDSTPRLHPAK